MKKLSYYSLKIQPYLLSDKLTTKKKKCLFKFRTHMVNVSSNSGKEQLCKLCNMEEGDSQEHTFQCIVVKLKCPELFNMSTEKYDDIFGNDTPKLIKMAKVCESVIRTREILLNS